MTNDHKYPEELRMEQILKTLKKNDVPEVQKPMALEYRIKSANNKGDDDVHSRP